MEVVINMNERKFQIGCLVCIFLLSMSLTNVSAEPDREDVLMTMRTASEFMVDTVSCNGGYVWSYTADLSRQWGEAPARATQIWVQGGTPDMGMLFLDAFVRTSDPYFRECAEKAANALIYGQHPLGGWHYFIDFDKTGLVEWYEKVFSNYKWGMEEYRHYYGNCTFDDASTTDPTRFLLRLYMTTLDPAYRGPLLKALDFILMSQYPNGGWPQRYPLRYEFAHDGLKDYTSLYTFNDGVINNNISMLVEAYEQLGNEEYMKAARRGMDFFLISQGPEEQAAWADQHGMDLLPAWGRTHEPAGYMPRYTVANIRDLMKFYRITGERRYLKPIPGALNWLERSALKVLDDGRLELAANYEVGTNLPIGRHQTDKVTEEGYGLFLYDKNPPFIKTTVNIKYFRSQYERISALSPVEAVAEYRKQKLTKRTSSTVNPDDVDKLIGALDKRGAWIVEVKVPGMDIDYDWPPGVKFSDATKSGHADTNIQGISTRAFIQNIHILLNYLGQLD